jgi:hypothetical protein
MVTSTPSPPKPKTKNQSLSPPKDVGNVCCSACDYSLNGLSPGRVCPECGLPIQTTLDRIEEGKCDLLAPPASIVNEQRVFGYTLLALLISPFIALCFESRLTLARSDLAPIWTVAFLITSLHGFTVAARTMKYRDWQVWFLLATLGFIFGICVMNFF